MADQTTQSLARSFVPSFWTVAAACVAGLVLLPIVSVVWLALNPSENIWPHLWATTLPRYFGNTVVLMLATGTASACIGATAAWLVTAYDFPGRRSLQWLLLLPLSVPAYVGAYALTDFLEYAGPVQTTLRAAFGWESARDYWFPEVRSRGAAILVLTMALYPYVYLLVRAAFREQPGNSYEVARALGAGPVARFWRVGLPLARPALAAGVAIVMMETVNDFGTVDYFAVQTLTTGIFSVWLQMNNVGGAAQIACLILVLILALVALERIARRHRHVHRLSRSARPTQQVPLHGASAWAATAFCAAPVIMGFILPVGVLGSHALRNLEFLADARLVEALRNTLLVGGTAALVTVAAALVLVYGVRLSAGRGPRTILPLTTIGYAAPGAVLGVGILIPLAALDNRVADAVLAITGKDPGLILTGSASAIVFAYSVRFFAIAQGAADAAMGRISPNVPMAARALGRTAGGALRDVYVPLIRGSVATALLLVFVDCVKELPATFLLRPFGFETLATRTHEQASLEKIGEAAPAALMIVAVGLVAVGILARTTRERLA